MLSGVLSFSPPESPGGYGLAGAVSLATSAEEYFVNDERAHPTVPCFSALLALGASKVFIDACTHPPRCPQVVPLFSKSKDVGLPLPSLILLCFPFFVGIRGGWAFAPSTPIFTPFTLLRNPEINFFHRGGLSRFHDILNLVEKHSLSIAK